MIALFIEVNFTWIKNNSLHLTKQFNFQFEDYRDHNLSRNSNYPRNCNCTADNETRQEHLSHPNLRQYHRKTENYCVRSRNFALFWHSTNQGPAKFRNLHVSIFRNAKTRSLNFYDDRDCLILDRESPEIEFDSNTQMTWIR